MSSKQSKAIPTEIMIRVETVNCPHSLLVAAKDATINAENVLLISMIDEIVPFLPL